MDEELERELVKRYPILYKDHGGDPRQTGMAWGISVGNGWYHIIDDMSAAVSSIGAKYELRVIADQVKEKFGGLRFYYHIEGHIPWYHKRFKWVKTLIFKVFSPKAYWKFLNFRKKIWRSPEEKISDLVSDAEMLSYKTCEQCSQPGKRRGGGWIRVLCEECAKKK